MIINFIFGTFIFDVYLNYVINKIKEYFVNVENDIKEEFLKKIYKNIIY
ncbi:hypothetical protein [Fusobacterium nucleatum]|uniref:Uncharacterized protein n=1 Tax=Fusobacterium nucleatum subsp. nucleatum (strain ATCC 23726 / VPI 4351) TaxID=525283 RepID=D5RC17_FUSN2|nr:hypothetical protein HMPREF0397_0752 [Fusobacterium nucleatum subsp. nucleatum ATCC 23726]